jgi:cellulose synthase/poly-beta-1,6-N-acetylglucosamine synthase-like glycosyltransferase
LLGYPLLLYAVRFPSRPVQKNPAFEPTVSVLMAVYNGELFVGVKLDNLLELDYPRQKLDVVVISDGSTDGTDAIVRGYASRGVRLLSVPRGGKAAALNAGLAEAKGEIVFFCDVRQRIERKALKELVANFADERVGAVTGELRILASKDGGGEQANLDVYWRYELWARRIHSRAWSLFNTTGCIYAMRRGLLNPIPSNTLVDDGAFPLQAYLQGYRVVFDDAAIAVDFPTEKGGELRRRMRTMAGVWQLWARHPRLLLWPHRMWLHFVSHKLGRLLVPWCLLLAGAASLLWPPSIWKSIVISLELGFLVLAGVGRWWRRDLPGYRIASMAATFVAMNVAALLSVVVFVVPPQKLWRDPTKVEMEEK